MSGKKNSEEGIFERDVEVPLEIKSAKVESAEVNHEEIKAKYTLAWMAEKLGGAKESLVEFATKLPTAPISWLTEKEKKHIHLSGQDKFLESLTANPGKVAEGYEGPENKVSVSRKVAGTVARGGASIGIFTIDSIAAVGMALAKSPKRAVGSVALFANMLRHGIHAVEDKFNDRAIKANDKEVHESHLERINASKNALGVLETTDLSKNQIEQFNNTSKAIFNAYDEESLSKAIQDYKNFTSVLNPKVMEKIDKLGENLIEAQDKFIKAKSKHDILENKASSRIAHDEKFSNIPGVKEMRENINTAHGAAGYAGKTAKSALNYTLEGAKAIGSSILGKMSGKVKSADRVEPQPTGGRRGGIDGQSL